MYMNHPTTAAWHAQYRQEELHKTADRMRLLKLIESTPGQPRRTKLFRFVKDFGVSMTRRPQRFELEPRLHASESRQKFSYSSYQR